MIGIGLIGLWNTKATSFIYASPAILILGYLAQYAILPMRVVSASLRRRSAVIGGSGMAERCGMARDTAAYRGSARGRGLLAAWLISYVFCVRDVAISIVVYPPGYDTLPVRILTLMANGAPSLISALCIILIAVTLLPLGAAGLWLKFGAAARERNRIPLRHQTLSRQARYRSLSFMIEAGERVVLFGPPGCGKSTTLLLVAGLVAPDAGEISSGMERSFRRLEEFTNNMMSQ